MTLADQRERQRRERLERLTALQRELYTPRTEQQRRESAEALGCPDVLPDPQDELELHR